MRVKDIQIGETYNGVKVLEDLGPHKGGRRYLCLCPRCGSEFEVCAQEIGARRGCKNCVSIIRYKDITGNRYGRLVAIRMFERKNKTTKWLCKCDCGNTVVVYQSNLAQNTYSCGCLKKEMRLLGGNKRNSASIEFGAISKHPLHSIWNMMKSRCYKPYCISYKNYGGRGIRVCDRWLGENGFEHFVTDMGERPSKKHTIERIDSNGDYCPENCRWATYTEQNRNRRNTIYVVLDGVKIPLAKVCQDYNLPYGYVSKKIRKGVEINDILQKYNK